MKHGQESKTILEKKGGSRHNTKKQKSGMALKKKQPF